MKERLISGFGVNVDLNNFSENEVDKIIKALIKLKVSWVRLEICYIKYTFSQRVGIMLYFCKLCQKNNIQIVALLTQFVPGSLKNVFFPHHSYTPVTLNIKSFLNFVEYISNVLNKQIFYWEIWNEQNSKRFWTSTPSPAEYVDFLKKVRIIILKNQPKAKIIFGGINGNDVTPIIKLPKNIVQFKGFIMQSLDLGVAKYVDMIAFHPYSLSCYVSVKNREKIFLDIKRNIMETIKKYKSSKLIISEIGVSPVLNFKINSYDVAVIYKKLVKLAKKLDIPICIYALSDNSPKHYSVVNPDRDFGFLDHNLNEKQLFKEFMKLGR
jgi:hypothetical protein